METKYQDEVERTFGLYGPQIGEALIQLKRENPNFGRYEFTPENVVETRFDGDNVTGISFFDVKKLEAKVKELTGDPKAKLIRTGEPETDDKTGWIDSKFLQ